MKKTVKSGGLRLLGLAALAAALMGLGARSASASEFEIIADSFTVANQVNLSSVSYFNTKGTLPANPAAATFGMTTPGGLYFDGTYYKVWDNNASAWVNLATGTVVGVAAGSIDTSKLATDAVTTIKILDANVTTAKLATGAVDTAKLAVDSVTGAKILNATIDTAKLNATIQAQLALAGTVTAGYIDTSKLAADAVTTINILNANVTTAKLANGSVDTNKLAADAVTGAKILNGTIDTAKLNADIQAKLTLAVTGTGTAGKVSRWTASGVLGDSTIQDNGTNVGIGAAPTAALLNVGGTGDATFTNTGNASLNPTGYVDILGLTVGKAAGITTLYSGAGTTTPIARIK